jgi:hypothetical protein
MQNAIAFCDNDVVVVAWSYGQKVEGCMGFAVYRIDPAGAETALPSMAVFPGFTPKRGQTTASFPCRSSTGKTPMRAWSPIRAATGASATRSSRSPASPAA